MSFDASPSHRPRHAGDMSRREFLGYAWLASLGFMTLQFGLLVYQFAMPRRDPTELGGPTNLGPARALPAAGEPPLAFERAKFWWVATSEGALALSAVCTHLGCICEWRSDQVKFTCPCHGSQFQRDGACISGPAPRSLDRFVIRAVDEDGTELARTSDRGDPLQLPADSHVIVETGQLIKGEAKT